MRFIEGLGYVDNTAYIDSINAANKVSGKSKDSSDKTNSFDTIFKVESDKLSGKVNVSYDLESIFDEAAAKFNIPKNLLVAVAYNESGFKSDATSSSGAMGIMQLMPETAKSYGVTDAYDPYQNIMAGANLLSKLKDMYDGNISLMLAAYNAGPGNVAKYDGVPPFKETQNYIAKVLATMQSDQSIPDTLYSVNKEQPALSGTISFNKDNLETLSTLANAIISATIKEGLSSIRSNDEDSDSDSSSLSLMALSAFQDDNTEVTDKLDTIRNNIQNIISDSDNLDSLYSYSDYLLLGSYKIK